MQRLVYNKFIGGISNDPSVGGTGSVYDAQGVDVHSDSKEVKLSKSFDTLSLVNERANGQIIGSIYESNTKYIELSKDGYLSSLLNNDLNLGFVNDELGTGYNIGKITTPTDTYGFYITSTGINQWTYDGTIEGLGTYDSAGTGINTDPSFDLGTGWTVGANWTISGGQASHTAGSTAVLSRPMTSVVAQKYRLAVQGNVTAGDCEVHVAGVNIATIEVSTNSTIPTAVYTAAGTSELLEFVPSSDFVGDIYFCNVQAYNVTTYTQAFNESCPFIIIENFLYIGNGSEVTEIDTTTGTWVVQVGTSVDEEYTIKGITKIGDQVFIYTTNGAGSRQYLWDGASAFVGRSIPWADKPIINVATFANQDYVITGGTNRQTLSLVNGYQLQPIIQTPDYVGTWNRIYFSLPFTNSIETIGSQLLIPGDGGIYTYGSKNPGFAKALVKEFLHSGGSIDSLFFREDLAYTLYAYTYGNINGTQGNYRAKIDMREGGSEQYGVLNNQHTGWIEINPIFGNTYSNVKNFEKICSGIKIETDTQVNVYRTTNENFANVYITGSGYTFAADDTYTNGGRTYTVVNVTEMAGKSGYILHCSYSGTEILNGKITGTFTRTAGSGPATTYVDLVRYGYELIGQILDATTNDFNKAYEFNKASFVVELISFNSDYTPRLFDINLYYDEKDDN